MSSINGIGPGSPVSKIVQQPIHKEIPVDAPSQHPALDKLELSGMSHLLQSLKSSDVRAEKISEIRARIEDGAYSDTDEKLDIAADKMLDELLDQ